MPEEFEKTFIPRKRVNPSQAGLRIQTTVDTFTAVGLLVFSLVFFCGISLYGAQLYVKKDISKLEKQAISMAQIFDQSEIESLVMLDKKVLHVDSILSKHISITAVFDFLEQTTARNVVISRMSFSDSPTAGLTLEVSGEAQSYNTLANQAKSYSNSKTVKSAVFSAVTPNTEGGINFDAAVAVNIDNLQFVQ